MHKKNYDTPKFIATELTDDIVKTSDLIPEESGSGDSSDYGEWKRK